MSRRRHRIGTILAEIAGGLLSFTCVVGYALLLASDHGILRAVIGVGAVVIGLLLIVSVVSWRPKRKIDFDKIARDIQEYRNAHRPSRY